MPAFNHRFKSSYDYRVPASGRFARGTVSGGGDQSHNSCSIAKFLPTRLTLLGSDVESYAAEPFDLYR